MTLCIAISDSREVGGDAVGDPLTVFALDSQQLNLWWIYRVAGVVHVTVISKDPVETVKVWALWRSLGDLEGRLSSVQRTERVRVACRRCDLCAAVESWVPSGLLLELGSFIRKILVIKELHGSLHLVDVSLTLHILWANGVCRVWGRLRGLPDVPAVAWQAGHWRVQDLLDVRRELAAHWELCWSLRIFLLEGQRIVLFPCVKIVGSHDYLRELLIVIVFIVIRARWVLVWDALGVACAGPCLFQGNTSLVVSLEVVLGETALLHREDKGDVLILLAVIRLIFIGRVCNQSMITFHTSFFIVFDVDWDVVFRVVDARLRSLEEIKVVRFALKGHWVLAGLHRVGALTPLGEIEHDKELVKILIIKTFL